MRSIVCSPVLFCVPFFAIPEIPRFLLLTFPFFFTNPILSMVGLSGNKCFCFSSLKNVFMSPSFPKDIFVGYRIVDQQFIFNALKACHFLSSLVSYETSAAIWPIVSSLLCIFSVKLLSECFLSLHIEFRSSIRVRPGMKFGRVYPVCLLNFLNLLVLGPLANLETFSLLILQILFSAPHFPFPLSDFITCMLGLMFLPPRSSSLASIFSPSLFFSVAQTNWLPLIFLWAHWFLFSLISDLLGLPSEFAVWLFKFSVV